MAEMIELARRYVGFEYRGVAALLRNAGKQFGVGEVERLWTREGLTVPPKQPNKGWLWLNDGSSISLKPERGDHVWSFDFVHCPTDDGRAFRTLSILGEFSRECLAVRIKRKLNSSDVIDALTDPFILRWAPCRTMQRAGASLWRAESTLWRRRALTASKR